MILNVGCWVGLKRLDAGRATRGIQAGLSAVRELIEVECGWEWWNLVMGELKLVVV